MRYLIVIFFLLNIESKSYGQDLDSIFNSKKEIVLSITDSNKKTMFLYQCGEYFYYKSINKSEYFYNQSLRYAQPKSSLKGRALWKLGLIAKNRGELGGSLRKLLKAKNIFKNIKDYDRFASIHYDIGALYRYKNQEAKELEFYKKGISVKGQKDRTIGKSFLHLGNYYSRNQQLDSSVYCLNKALDIFKQLNLERRIYNVYNVLANTYYKQGKYKQIISLRKTVLKYGKLTKNKMLISVNYHNIGAAYSKLNNPQLALLYLDSAIVVAKEENFKGRLAKSYKSKSVINKNLKDYKQAYKNHEFYKKYSDSIFQSQLSKRVKDVELRKQLEIEKKNLELENLKQASEKKLYLIVFVIFLSFSIPLLIIFYKSSINKKKAVEVKLDTEKRKKEVLSQKVETSESEIKKLVADNAMRLEFLKKLSIQIKDDKSKAECSNVKKYINSLSLKIQQQITTESKLTLLKNKIDSINDGFEQKLIVTYKDLSKTEREICALLRLNLSSKEIASIRCTSIDAVKAARYRIRKKMNIPKKEKIESFIKNL